MDVANCERNSYICRLLKIRFKISIHIIEYAVIPNLSRFKTSTFHIFFINLQLSFELNIVPNFLFKKIYIKEIKDLYKNVEQLIASAKTR